ncbi:hypothetical protein U1Q18_024431 [Sarracenia purpurea var. burkii]
MTMGRTIDQPPQKKRANQNKSTAATTATAAILELPASIIWDIFSRLPLISICWCKIVCKTWRDLLLDPYFAKLHRSSSPISLILHNITNYTHFGILELDDPIHLSYRRAIVKFRTKIDIPEGYIKIVGSCNGLLCLFDCFHRDTVIVCNPILGQTIILPKYTNIVPITYVKYGFGHSSSTDQYKVLRFVMTSNVRSDFDCEIYTIGSDDAWRRIGVATREPSNVVFLNGALHWIVFNNSSWLYYYFDVEKEQFESFSLPSDIRNPSNFLGVVDNCLYICDNPFRRINIWVMKNHGDIGSLILEWAFDRPFPVWMARPPRPIKTLKDGTVLLISHTILASYNPKTGVFERIDYRGFQLWNEAVIDVPSFFSLMDAAK